METIKVTTKYQITIPKSIRKKLNIKAGDILLVRTDGTRIILEPIIKRSNPLEDMLNLIKEPLNIDAVKLIKESWDEN